MEIEFNSLMAGTFEPVMEDILDGGHREYWLKGGRSSTKSSFVSLMIALGLLMDKDASAIIFRRVGNTIKDSVYAQMIWAIDALGQSGQFLYRRSPYEIIHRKTGQRIMFRGADDPVKSKSIKLTQGYFKFLWFEELSDFRGMEDIRTIKQSVFRGVERGCTFYSYNPPRTLSNWVNKESLIPMEDRLVHHSTYLDVPREWLKDEFIAEAEFVKRTNERATAMSIWAKRQAQAATCLTIWKSARLRTRRRRRSTAFTTVWTSDLPSILTRLSARRLRPIRENCFSCKNITRRTR